MKLSACSIILLLALFCLTLSHPTNAQRGGQAYPDSVVKRSDMYCAGYISESTLWPDVYIIGGEKENFKNSFSQGDVVFMNKGRNAGVRAGQTYSVIRPVGKMKHPFNKKRKMGTYVHEVGMIRVIQVNDKTSTAEVTVSCEMIEMGDMLKIYEEQLAPEPRAGEPLPLHGESSGDLSGQIVLARHGREYIATGDVVYIDVGETKGVKTGDYFTIYHAITDDWENVGKYPQDKIDQWRSRDYQSDHWRGGTFSNQAPRVKRNDVVRERPEIPRKVLGEMIVLKVEKGSATCVITRSVGEANIGDWVERNN
ncbi:MAG: hypothetical protein AB1757_03380 [Acidobacteriota bacterium]